MEGLSEVPANWLTSDGIRKGTDIVCEEEALSISISDGADLMFSLGMTMRTPGNDKELVIGLLYSEGIIDSVDEILNMHKQEGNFVVIIPHINEKIYQIFKEGSPQHLLVEYAVRIQFLICYIYMDLN